MTDLSHGTKPEKSSHRGEAPLKEVEVFTDGACSGNPGPGGWGAILVYKTGESHLRKHELRGGEEKTTNNRMELTAAIKALKKLAYPHRVALFTDSVYLRDGISLWITTWRRNGWKTAQGKPVKNIDLWLQLDESQSRHSVTWHWVKGHSGQHSNERADALARAGMEPYLGKEKEENGDRNQKG